MDTYRNYLQGLVNSGNYQGPEASALLSVVGDDGVVDQGFANQNFNQQTGLFENSGTNTSSWTAPQGVQFDASRGQIYAGDNWYGPSGINQLNEKFSGNYLTGGGSFGDTATLGATTGGSTGGTGGWTSQNQAAYDQALSVANSNLNRLPGQRDTALNNIDRTFNQRQNELSSGLNQARTNFEGGQTQNQQQRVGNENRINQQASQGLRALLRQIAASGGGGGSAYLYSAPQAVGDAAQTDLTGSGRNFAENQRALTTNFDQYERQNEQQGIQLGDWRGQQRQSAQSNSEQNKIGLLQALAQLDTQRQAAMGGDTTATLQPYIDKINTAQNTIDGLARFNPQYTGKVPAYAQPQLSRFALQDNPQIQNTTRNAMGGITPYLNLLLGNREEEQLA